VGLFDKITKNKDESAKDAPKAAPVSGPIGEEKLIEAGDNKVVLPKGGSALAYGQVVNPHITEKTSMLGASNQYVFKVAKTSSKLEIKKSIEELYNVEVEKVNVVNLPAKKRRLGKQIGIRPGVKKAVVTLKSGSSIQLN